MKLEPPAVFGEPVFARGVVGHDMLQTPPEVGIVVKDAPMHHLVRGAVLDDVLPQK